MDKKKIAIIGSGISGLSAAYFLSNKYEVHLFEKNKILGGHTRTINFKDDRNVEQSIDTGFIVFNNKNYPDLVAFFNDLNVKTEDSKMSFSVSCKSPNLEYGGSSLNTLFAQRKNIFSVKFISLLYEINKLYKIGQNYKINETLNQLTIDQFLVKNNFTRQIRDFHIYPMISSIWSTNNNDVKKFPLVTFLQFFNNHGLFNLNNRPQWRFVSGGSYTYIKALLKKNLFKYFVNTKIIKITRNNNKIQLFDDNKNIQIFDKIIFATHANEAIKLIGDISKEEKEILTNFKYTKNKAYLHSDNRLMPNKKLAWSSWNFLQKKDLNNNFSLTYWMNNLQKIDHYKNYFFSVNPHIKPEDIIDFTFFEHPIFNLETIEAQKKLPLIQNFKNTYYCGSYCGYGFHEDGIQSAAYIAKKLAVDLPWKRPEDFINRLNYI
ncbi:FAD-dependent oxidoreductase [Alphaproteobacteria bacterium]|nr:FAD-dependent oxidoreductase [Alphaproteobacteria bacterium]